MKYIADTIGSFIVGQIKKVLKDSQEQSREMRVILPSLPAQVVLRVGNALEEYRLHQAENGNGVRIVYKSAYALAYEWRQSENLEERLAAEEIIKKDWYDEENHLTQWRNIQRNSAEEDVLTVVLVGYDRVTDQASLADFFRLDFETLWKRIMRGSFVPWAETRMKEKPVEYEEEELAQANELLCALMDSSFADLTGVSSFLEGLDLSEAMDGRDAWHEMVKQLDQLGLPCMRGLGRARLKRKKNVNYYLSQSVEFFNYSRYLEETRRRKELAQITKFLDEVDRDNFDAELLGAYILPDDIESSLSAFAKGLKAYIETNNPEERIKLASVDFVFLLDEVLERKKKKSDVPPPKKPKKLTGLPLNVILRAVWITLGEFKAWTIDKKLLAAESLTDIQIHGDLFKHDCEGADAGELRQNANRFLRQMIGGLDTYLEDHLAFAPDPINDPERTIRVKSALCPAENEGSLGYERAKSSEPYLKFTVTIGADDHATKRAFIWRFPQLHPYRTMADMFGWFSAQAGDNPIPVFCVPYFEELMLAKDQDEVNRIIQNALQESDSPKIFNLLEAHGLDASDKAVIPLKSLGYQYARFMVKAHEQGIFSALNDFTSLEKAFREVYSLFLNDPECIHSQAGPLLFKAFCMLGERRKMGESFWMWRAHEPSLVVTPLHPALLEMMYHQHAYLCEGFVVAARQGLREAGARSFNERHWADLEDLAQVQWPLQGTLRGDEQILDTNVRSFDLIHLFGESPSQEATLTTRLLLRYDSEEDEQITDEDLFKETRESRLVQRVLEDYRSLNPHADDGMAIAAYCSADIQSLVAGVDGFLSTVFRERQQDRPYVLSLTLFAESQDDTTISRWVREWRERWETAEQSSKLSYYRGCRISVAHRMITREKNYAQFVTLLTSLDADIAFLFQFIRAGESGSRFVKTDRYDHRGSFRMFPVLEKMCCSVTGGGYEHTRERIISNRQFKLGTLHAGVMARLKLITDSKDAEYLVMGRGDFSQWARVVDELHNRAAWVVCIDPSVDEYLIAKQDEHGKRVREIIGFGSGVGAHGEYNYTVSTQEFSLAGIKRKISAHVSGKLGPWEHSTCEQIAESVTKEVLHMAGMSLVKATGPSEYVRDFIAYALVRKLLPRNPAAFCDEVISLDAFRHWFDSAPNGKRPDLIRITANIEDGAFVVGAQLIECKLGQQSERHLEKAHEQLENGLSHLISCFKPRQADVPEGLDDRPDQRYWWLQLHRLLASKGRVAPPELPPTVSALERLSDGIFTIRWSAAAVTFWTDSDREDIRKEDEWDFQYEGRPLPIQVISSGRQFVRLLCTKDGKQELPVNPSSIISFSSAAGEEMEHSEPTEDVPEQEGAGVVIGSTSDIEAIESVPEELGHEPGKKEISGAIPSIKVPERIYLGRGVKGGAEIHWEFGHPELSNRHMLIFGTSGMGKTYTIQALLCELGKHGQNTIIVDYTDGFHDKQLEDETRNFLKPMEHVVKLTKVPINPFRRQQEFLGGQALPEDPSNTAQRVMGVFSEVYGLGDQQRSAVYSAVKRGVDLHSDQMNLARLPELLQEVAKDNAAVATSASSVISKIQPFVDMDPFGQEDPESWEKLFTDQESHCHILQLAGYLKEASKLITEFSLIDLYWYYRTRGKKDRPRVIVLDEIQNLDQRLESPLGKFLTEGRKFGISLIMATQTLSNFQKEERDRLFQAGHKLFFRPAETEVKSYAQILESATHEKLDVWVHRLSELKKGECYSLGPALNVDTGVLETKAFRIRIDPLSSRLGE